MKAILIREHGGVDKLEWTDVPAPTPIPGMVVIAGRAVALNHLDLWVRRGVPGHKFPLPIIPGSEVAGVIESVGEPVGDLAGAFGRTWKAGDEVVVAPGFSCGQCVACLSGNDPLCLQSGIYGETVNGGCSERRLVPFRNLIPKPAALSFPEAASRPLDMVTAWHMLVARAPFRPGETILIQAGGRRIRSGRSPIAEMGDGGLTFHHLR